MVKRALSFLINAKLQPKLQRFSRAARRIFKLSNKAAGAVPRDRTAEHLSCKERAFPKGPREGHTEQPSRSAALTASPVCHQPREHTLGHPTVSLWPPTNGRAGLRTEYYGAEEVNKSTAPWRTEMQGPVKGKQTRAPVHPRRCRRGRAGQGQG